MNLPFTPELDTHTLYVSWLWYGSQPDIEKAINWRINHRIGQAFEDVQKMDESCDLKR